MTAHASRRAANLAFFSAFLHVAALIMSGFDEHIVLFGGGAVLWLVLGMGLARKFRLVGYLAFLVALIGAITMLGMSMGVTGSLPRWAFLAMLTTDFAIAVACFIAIWQPRPPRDTRSVLG
jgi:hypothetical protein